MTSLFQDLRYAVRTLARSPGFTAVVVLTLALGIGANAAVFSVIDALLLRALPVRAPQELVLLSRSGSWPGTTIGGHNLSYPMYRALQERAGTFDGLICRFRVPAHVGVRGATRRVMAELVSGNYFSVLGVPAALGRTITPADDDAPGAHPVAVLSYSYWKSVLGGDPGVIGQSLLVNGQSLTVIGVSARGFDGVEPDFAPQVRVPVTMAQQLLPHMSSIRLADPMTCWLQVFGRLKPGVSREAAQAALLPLYEQEVRPMKAKMAADSRFEVLPGQAGTSLLRDTWSTPLWALMAMVAVVLLLACVNIASLLVGRGLARRGEIAVRLALGAQRRRVIGQFVIESAVLAACGGILGVALAPLASGFLVRFLTTPEGMSGVSPAIDWRVLAFCLAASVGSVLLFGIVPAIASTRTTLASTLKQSIGGGATRGRLRMALAGVQMTLALVLVIGSILFARSLQNLYANQLGFATRSVVTFGIDPLLSGYSRERAEEVYARVKERLDAVPGVQSAALGLVRLLGGDSWKNGVFVLGYTPGPGDDVSGENLVIETNVVSPDYFRTLQIPLIAGREFAAADNASAPPVVIVNQSFVRRFLKGESVVGQKKIATSAFGRAVLAEIVGVVRDSRYDKVRGGVEPQIFVPYPQFLMISGMSVYVRSAIPAAQTSEAIRRTVAEVDPNVAIQALRTLDEQRDESLTTERLVALLAAAFGALATLLAAIGLFGVLNHEVMRRTRELGIRLALGAPGAGVVWLVLRRALLLLVAAACVAIPIALASARLVASQLVGITASDPWTIAGATLFLAVVTVMAAIRPALRAAKVDPMTALRCQ